MPATTCTVFLDKKRELRFGTESTCFIEELYDKSLSEAAAKGGTRFIVAVVASGLTYDKQVMKRIRPKPGEFDLTLIFEWFDKHLSKEEKPDLASCDNLESIIEKVGGAMRHGQPGIFIKPKAEGAAEEAPLDAAPDGPSASTSTG